MIPLMIEIRPIKGRIESTSDTCGERNQTYKGRSKGTIDTFVGEINQTYKRRH